MGTSWTMRRRFARGVLGSLVALLLAACTTPPPAPTPSASPSSPAAAPSASPASPSPSPASPLRIAAAANLRFALDEIVAAWATSHPEARVEPTYGSSGNFFAQIKQGAPFDLFFSADMDYPRRLVEAGLADGSTLRVYAIGQLVVWVPTGSALDVASKGLGALADPSVRRVAIANPEHAPYGRAAMAALEAAGLADVVNPKLVFGDNVDQAAQFVESGNADAGLIPLSLAKAPTLAGRGRFAVVPQELYPPLEQGVVILTKTDRGTTARAFIEFVLGPEGRAILARYGYLAPK